MGCIKLHILDGVYKTPELRVSYTDKRLTLDNCAKNTRSSLFNSKELDPETSLYYYGSRYYDARVSLWLSVDPLATKVLDISPYIYVDNSPIKYSDPTGLRKFNVIQDDGSIINEEIDDGIDETHDIYQIDFIDLKTEFSFDDTDDKQYYNQHFEQLGLGTKGYEIAVAARKWEGSSEYNFDVKKGDFPAKTDKCNKFVYDILREHEVIPKYPVGSPPMAGTYASNQKIKGLEIVDLENDVVKLGDIVAGSHRYSNGASGHVEIITRILPGGAVLSTGASGVGIEPRTKAQGMLDKVEQTGGWIFNPVRVRRATND